MKTNITDAKTVAKHYRETHGWNVIPLRKGTKSAAVKWRQFQDRNVTDEKFEDFDWSGGNVGIITGKTSELMVVDVDDPKKAERWLEQRGLSFPDTAEVKTYRGRHYYFRIPEGEEVRSKNVKDGEDVVLEVKANGSLVVAPPSAVTHSGIDSGLKWKDQHVYEWERHPDEAGITECPAWLLEELRKIPERTSHDYDWSKALSGVPEGERDNHVWEMAWRCAYAGLPIEIAKTLIMEAADNCTPPFDRDIALEKVERAYATTTSTPPPAPPEGQDSEEVGILMSNVKAEKVNWLWDGRIPFGKITVLDGDPGLGKSVMTMDLAARLTTGRPLPDGVGVHGGVGALGGVVIISAEDGLADTIKPRLDAAGADTSKILAISTVDDKTLAIPEDIPTIERAIRRVGARLVIVDPLMAFLSGKANQDQDVRKSLTPLKRMAESTGVAVLMVRHLNKQDGGKAIYRGGSSIGIIGAARSGLVVEKHPEDKELRVLAHSKHNLAPEATSLTYRITTASNGAAQVVWEGVTDLDADDVLSADASEEARVKNWLEEKLSDGPVLQRTVEEEASKAEIDYRTLERAKKNLGAKSKKDRQWYWYLPGKEERQGRQERQDSQGRQDSEPVISGVDAEPHLPTDEEMADLIEMWEEVEDLTTG